MSFRAALHAWVRDQLNVPVYDARLPIRPNMPALVQRFVTGRSDLSHSNPLSLLPRRVQFDIYANNDVDVDTLSTRLLKALDGYHGPMGDVSIGWAGMDSDFDRVPQEIKGGEVRYGRILDFTIAYQEVRP
jgi:hypothetical protein